MEPILVAERETLQLRLLAVAGVVAGLYNQQEQVLRDPGALLAVLGLAALYLTYTLSLRSLILPRLRSPYVVFAMVLVDVGALLAATHLAGGLQTNMFILFPVLVIFYAIHLDYASSFFAAATASCGIALYTVVAGPQSLELGAALSTQIPLLFLLAYFGGFLSRRTTRERTRREALGRYVRLESGLKGLG